jgi:hypothetical protein
MPERAAWWTERRQGDSHGQTDSSHVRLPLPRCTPLLPAHPHPPAPRSSFFSSSSSMEKFMVGGAKGDEEGRGEALLVVRGATGGE